MSDSDLRKVLEQGVVNIYPAKEKLAEALKKDASKLTFYLGVDPTAPFIHLGHAIPLRKLEQLRRVGAKVILLIGNFTATIGDPTDKAATRKVLSSEEVEANAKSYLSLISPVLDLDNAENPVTVKYNKDWWGSMDLKSFLGLAQKVTVQQLLERDMFQVRQKEGKPIYLHEFIYPLLQGYDGVEMKVDGEVGGNDQTFNMLMGRDLSAEFLDKDKFVISVNLLADPSGKKMGKSEGNAVALDAKAPDMFGKIMSWPDAVIESAFELLTDIEAGQAKEIISNLGPREAKVKLAKEIMKPFHTEEDIAGAEAEFNKVFRDKEAPDNITTMKFAGSLTPVEVLIQAGFALSKSDARRVIEQGGFSVDGEVIEDPEKKIELISGSVIKKGKQNFVKVE